MVKNIENLIERKKKSENKLEEKKKDKLEKVDNEGKKR